jgi:hypothetical protein
VGIRIEIESQVIELAYRVLLGGAWDAELEYRINTLANSISHLDDPSFWLDFLKFKLEEPLCGPVTPESVLKVLRRLVRESQHV